MRLTYRRDDDRRWVELISEGPFEPEPFIDALRRQCDEGTWHYAMLSDARGLTGPISFQDLDRVHAQESACGPNGGPLVIITNNPALFGKACAYAVLAQVHRPATVVQDRSEAEQWLREQGFGSGAVQLDNRVTTW